MNLGSIKYPCAPFSSFVSIEIARNLLERYNGTEPLAEAFEMDVSDKLLHQKVSAELETVAFFRKEQVCGGRSHVSWEIPHDALYSKRERTQGVNFMQNCRGFVVLHLFLLYGQTFMAKLAS